MLLVFVPLWIMALVSCLRTVCLLPGLRRISPIFSLKCFIVLCITLRSKIHFGLIFIRGAWYVAKPCWCLLAHIRCATVSAPSPRRLFSHPLNSAALLSGICRPWTWDLYSLPLTISVMRRDACVVNFSKYCHFAISIFNYESYFSRNAVHCFI